MKPSTDFVTLCFTLLASLTEHSAVVPCYDGLLVPIYLWFATTILFLRTAFTLQRTVFTLRLLCSGLSRSSPYLQVTVTMQKFLYGVSIPSSPVLFPIHSWELDISSDSVPDYPFVTICHLDKSLLDCVSYLEGLVSVHKPLCTHHFSIPLVFDSSYNHLCH